MQGWNSDFEFKLTLSPGIGARAGRQKPERGGRLAAAAPASESPPMLLARGRPLGGGSSSRLQAAACAS